MQKLDHQFNVQLEHNNPIFEAVVGSYLTETNKENSDRDSILFYSHKVQINPFFAFPNNDEVLSITYDKGLMQEQASAILANYAAMLLRPKNLKQNEFSHAIKHLAAIKFDKISIINQELFSKYYDFICVPGNGLNFWQQARLSYENFWNCIPSVEYNWSQKFDGNNQEHVDKKNNWNMYNDYYPTVDSKVGYDINYVVWLLTDMILIKHILFNDHIIDKEEVDTIMRIKNKDVSWDEIKTIKIQLWKNARKGLESPMSSYLLGRGMSLQEAQQKNLFGLQGFLNTVNSFEEIA
jgi:hypothetical protein